MARHAAYAVEAEGGMKRLWLFLRIVWRQSDPVPRGIRREDSKYFGGFWCRVSAKDAWHIAKTVHP